MHVAPFALPLQVTAILSRNNYLYYFGGSLFEL